MRDFMAKESFEEYRARILSAARKYLESNGVDVNQIEKEAVQSHAARRQFSRPLKDGVSSKFQTIPEGNQEFRRVGKKGCGLAPRCQAKSRHSGWRQCNAIAKDGFRVCPKHGARSHGTKTPEGIKRSAAHLLVHGRETREIRRRRSEASKARRELDKLAKDNGMAEPAVRGPRPRENGKIDYVKYWEQRARRVARIRKKLWQKKA